MNKMNLKQIILYILSISILFAIPFFTIAYNANTLRGGTEFLFKAEAFDPYDIFRGNYLHIQFEENTAPFIAQNNTESVKDGHNTECYVTISTKKDGFAYFNSVSTTKPTNTSNYFKTTGYYNKYSNKFMIDTPTRYYMNEEKSEIAEKIYRDNIDNAYVKVRIKNGKMVIVGVYVNNILIDSID